MTSLSTQRSPACFSHLPQNSQNQTRICHGLLSREKALQQESTLNLQWNLEDACSSADAIAVALSSDTGTRSACITASNFCAIASPSFSTNRRRSASSFAGSFFGMLTITCRKSRGVAAFSQARHADKCPTRQTLKSQVL